MSEVKDNEENKAEKVTAEKIDFSAKRRSEIWL